jgi:lysophospholipid acyltransferase
VTGSPTANKRVYDFLSYLTTQVAFAFATAPFLILTFSGSIQVWARVYFYCIVGTAVSMAFFASPAKLQLKKRLEERQARAGVKLTRTASQDSIASRAPVLGLSADPQRDLDEAIQEIQADLAAKKKSA